MRGISHLLYLLFFWRDLVLQEPSHISIAIYQGEQKKLTWACMYYVPNAARRVSVGGLCKILKNEQHHDKACISFIRAAIHSFMVAGDDFFIL